MALTLSLGPGLVLTTPLCRMLFTIVDKPTVTPTVDLISIVAAL